MNGDFGLEGRVAVISGGARVIGRAIAERGAITRSCENARCSSRALRRTPGAVACVSHDQRFSLGPWIKEPNKHG